jgi:hypothetical protein
MFQKPTKYSQYWPMLYTPRHKELKLYLYSNHDNTTVCQHHSNNMAVNMVCHGIAIIPFLSGLVSRKFKHIKTDIHG